MWSSDTYKYKWYGSTLIYKVYELMGVDTEKEMDIVTRKVDRVFKVMILLAYISIFSLI